MQIGVTTPQLTALLEAVPAAGNNTVLYVLDAAGANVTAFASVTYGSETLVVTITDVLPFSSFQELLPNRNMLLVSSLTA